MTTLRKAGLIEQFHLTRQSLKLDSCVICAAKYSRSLSKDILYSALKQVIQEHAALGVCVIDESIESSVFTTLDQINLDDIVAFTTGQDLIQIFEEQFSTHFDTHTALPLWRIVVLDETTVVFAWHHAIGDGLSSVAFHKSLCRALNMESMEPGNIAIPAAVSALTPPIEVALDISPSLLTVLWEVVNLFIPSSWKRGASAWTGSAIGTDPSVSTTVRFMEFSSTETSRLHVIARSHHASLTGAIFAITVAALSGTIDPVRFHLLAATIPVSLRTYSNTPANVFADYAAACQFHPDANPMFSWNSASLCSQQLKRQGPSSGQYIGLLKYIFGNYARFFTSKFGQKRQHSFELSNLGLYENDEPSRYWKVEEIHFGQCDSFVGSALKVNVVGLNGLTISVTSGQDVLEEGFLDRFIDRFITIFHDLVRE